MRIALLYLLFIFVRCEDAHREMRNESPSEKEYRAEIDSDVKNEAQNGGTTDSTQNQKYLKTRPTISIPSSNYRVKRINDQTLPLPIDVLETYGSIVPNFALLDFNQDGHDDLFFEYYGRSGSGEKNVIDVYFFDPEKHLFVDTFFKIMNPRYFFDKKIITTYYYGLGGGYAEKYQISNGKLELIESIQIEINSLDGFEALFSYSGHPFKDTMVVRDNMVRLPDEYGYTRIIRLTN